MGWYGPPSGSCSCCLPCNQRGWADFIAGAGYSGWSMSASGTYISYSPSSSGGFSSTGFAGSATECDTAANGSTAVTIAGGGSCRLEKYFCGTVNNLVCNGVFRTQANSGVIISGSIGTTCVNNVPTFTQSASMTIPISGCNPTYLLPNPVDDLGYSVTQTNFFGDPIAWRKFGTGGYFYQIVGCGGADPVKGAVVSGVQKYTFYLVQALYSKVTTNTGDILATITLVPDYNPASITGTVTLT